MGTCTNKSFCDIAGDIVEIVFLRLLAVSVAKEAKIAENL